MGDALQGQLLYRLRELGGRAGNQRLREALAEFERSLIAERTRAGMRAARARGVRVGRKPVLTSAQIAHARTLIESGESPTAVARSLKVGRATLYRALHEAGPRKNGTQ